MKVVQAREVAHSILCFFSHAGKKISCRVNEKDVVFHFVNLL